VEEPLRVRVLVVQGATLLREGLRALLERDGFDVVADPRSLADALATRAEPDVILADIWLPDARGTSTVSRLGHAFPSAAILVLTGIDDPVEVRGAFEAGARGYILSEASSAELAEAVRRVAAGSEYLHPSLGASLARVQPGATGPGGSGLSSREREILRLVALGHTNAAIAGFLGVSLRTVEAHRGRIYQKLGLKTRADLVRYASQSGLTAEP
jgi:two-component system, NarL family, response regulator NreC